MSDYEPPEKLEDLDRRLNQACNRHAGNKPGSSLGKEEMSGYSMAIRIGTEMVAALIVGVGIGYLLDNWLDTKPWFLVVFFFLGAGAGVLNVYRAASGLGMATGYANANGEPSGGVASQMNRDDDAPEGASGNNKESDDK